MATITFTLSTAALNEVIDTLCDFYNYRPVIDGSPNPETRGSFAKRMMIYWLRERVMDHRRRVAENSISTVNPDIT
jgi:hypothetical protein